MRASIVALLAVTAAALAKGHHPSSGPKAVPRAAANSLDSGGASIRLETPGGGAGGQERWRVDSGEEYGSGRSRPGCGSGGALTRRRRVDPGEGGDARRSQRAGAAARPF